MFQLQMPSKTITTSNRLFRVFFTLWVAFSYLGLALFYPATCDPSGLRGDYVAVNIPTASSFITWQEGGEHISSLATLVDAPQEILQDSGNYIVSSSSSNASWLLNSRQPTSTTTYTLTLDVGAVALLSPSWDGSTPVASSERVWLNQFHHQFKDLPLKPPPKFSA